MCSSENPMPIYTLPLVTKKMYVINSPALAQPVLRSKALSFEPFILEFTPKLLDLAPATVQRINTSVDPATGEAVVDGIVTAVHESMSAGHLRPMNAAALGYIAESLGSLALHRSRGPTPATVPNLWLFLRDLLTLSTTDVLWSRRTNPFRLERPLVEDLWIFDEELPHLITSPLPRLACREGHAARRRIQAALGDWYASGQDVDDPTPVDEGGVAAMTRQRAAALRRHGLSPREIGELELSLVHVATQNAIPTLFWVFAHVLARPDWTARIRAEVEALVEVEEGDEGTKRTARIDVNALEKRAPFLVACYNEAMRLGTHSPGTRRVMEDTTVSPVPIAIQPPNEPPPAAEYLLRKGVDVQIPVGVAHRKGGVWGREASATPSSPAAARSAVSWSPEFDPDNFLPTAPASAAASAVDRTRRAAFTPFGGGKHLCPGRRFAFVEILGVVCILLVGFEFEPAEPDAEGRFKVPAMRLVRLGNGMSQPEAKGKGTGLRVRRRDGWEAVEWKFTC